MTAILRIRLAILLFAGLATPVAGQQAPPEAIAPAPSTESAVGPPQLQDFSLPGTVTRRPEGERQEQPAAQPRPAPSQPAPQQRPAAQSPDSDRRQPAVAEPAQPARNAAQTNSIDRRGSPPSGPNSVPTASTDDAAPTATPSTFATGGAIVPSSPDVAGPVDMVTGNGGNGMSPWPWILGLGLVGLALILYARRRAPSVAAGQAREGRPFPPRGARAVTPTPTPSPPARLAGSHDAAKPPPRVEPRAVAPDDSEGAPLSPPVASPAAAPVPSTSPAPPPPVPAGIVSTRLRPWIDMELRPGKLVVDADKVHLLFDLLVLNSGSGPARDLLIEAALFNAGPDQDRQIADFFAREAGVGEPVALVPPLKHLNFTSTVRLARDDLTLFSAGGRELFVPVVAINALYRWGGGTGQSAMSFLVGRQGSGPKLAPLTLPDAGKEIDMLDCRALDGAIRR